MKSTSKRQFITDTAVASAGLMVLPGVSMESEQSIPKSDYQILYEVRKFRKMDAYCTAIPKMSDINKFGIERMFTGKPMSWAKWTPDEFISANH